MSEIVGIGSNITECLRIARMIDRYGELFINRIYAPAEIEWCRQRKQATQHFAGRWAAKEAVLKAIGERWRPGIRWLDVEIRSDEAGRLSVDLRGTMKDIVEERGISRILLTISHCHTHATAYAIVFGKA